MKEMTIGEFVYRNRAYFVVAIILIISLNAGVLGYRKYNEERNSKEKAYKDSVANISSMEKFRIDAEPILSSDNKLNYYLLSVDINQFKLPAGALPIVCDASPRYGGCTL